jgi:hypothetical protein
MVGEMVLCRLLADNKVVNLIHQYGMVEKHGNVETSSNKHVTLLTTLNIVANKHYNQKGYM